MSNRSFSAAGLALALALVAGLASAQPKPASSASLASPMAGVALPNGMREVTQVEGITEYRLANGLQLLLVPDDSKPTTTVNVTYRVGSRHEGYGETGMAHLLEHMLFKGTPTTPKVWPEFTKRGLRANGTTWVDRTNYFASFAANADHLRWYLSWQADAMVHSNVARADLDTEMTVVRNEMERNENSPSRMLYQEVLGSMYQWHNYGKDTIGARSDVENVDIAHLQAFYRTYYQPDNATLTISGRFDPARVRGWVSEFFGVIPKPTRVLAPTYTLDPTQDGERSVTVRRAGGSPRLMLGFHVMAGADPDFAAIDLLSQVMGDSPGGRLHKRLVARQLASSAWAEAWDLAEPGVTFYGVELAPGQSVDRARDELMATVASLTSEPVTAEELERARTQWLNGWDKNFDDPEKIGVQISSAIAQGDWRLYFLARDHVRRVTLADIRRVAGEWLVRDNRTLGVYLPTAHTERAPAPARVDVAALVKDYKGDPDVVQAEAFDATPANLDARTQDFTLASGLRVGLLPKGARGQTVQARLRLHYGSVESLKNQETLASFVAALIDKGGAGMSRQEIADAFDRLQANVSFGASGQTVFVSITTRRERLPAVIALVGKLLREPAFAAAPLEELRQRSLAAIESMRKEPGVVVGNLVRRHGNPYPRGDLRYSPTFEESEQDVRAVTLAQLSDFHRRTYSAASGEFAAVGDMDAVAVRNALTAAFGTWSQPAAGPLAYVRAPRPLLLVAPARFVERTPDKQNANLFAALAIPINDSAADYPALLMANQLFGGGGSSRLWKRIREGEGLSYSVGSGITFSPFEANSTFAVGAIFAPQNQPRVETALREELVRSLRDGFTADELEQARGGLLSARRLSRAQDGGVASALALNLELKRSFARSQEVDDALKALTIDQVNAAWRKYVDADRLVMGWGGDFKPAP
ncbi:MAG: pitrilysin family protein [Caldimonas sp.]